LSSPNVSGITNVTRTELPEPKFKIGDWVSGTDDNPSRIKSFQWMEQEGKKGLYRYRVAHHFGEDSWAEGQLSSVPAQNISQAPTWGQGGTRIESITTDWPDQSGEVDLSGGVLGAPLPVSVTGDSGQQGVLEQFLDETSGNRMDVGFGGTGMANGDLPGEGPFSRYLRRRGVGMEGGIGLGSRAGRHIRGQWPEIEDLMEQMEAIRTAGGTNQNYLGFDLDQFAPLAGSVRERANLGASALQSLFGMGQERREDEAMSFENAFIDEEGLPTGKYNMEWLQNLVRRGTRATQGRIGSRHIASRLPYLREQFDLRRGAPGMATNFIDFFRNRYGL